LNKKKVAVQEAKWDEENAFIELYPGEPVPAGTDVEIHLSNVRNPRNNGMYYFNCRVQTPGDVPILRDLGTWILEIS
jgi:beta-lactam-binding protein with PASTA domain